jgi:hypothetical protein
MTVFLETRYTERELEKISNVLSNGISNREWEGLKARYELPDPARHGIDQVIRAYWDWRVDIAISKRLPPKISKSISQLRDLRESLAALRDDRDFFKGTHVYYEQSPQQQSQFMDGVLASLQKLDSLLVYAQDRAKAPARRPSHRGIWQALRLLANYMEFWKLELTDDPNSIAHPVLLLAEPKLTKRQITSVLKEFVAIRPKWGWTGVWVEDHFR